MNTDNEHHKDADEFVNESSRRKNEENSDQGQTSQYQAQSIIAPESEIGKLNVDAGQRVAVNIYPSADQQTTEASQRDDDYRDIPEPLPHIPDNDDDKPRRTFSPSLLPSWFSFSESENQLWVSDGELLEIFDVQLSSPSHTFVLPSAQVKQYLPQLWNGLMVFTDWAGTLNSYNNKGQPQPIYKAKYDDVPIHCLSVSPEGYLLAGRWDGQIQAWDTDNAKNKGPALVKDWTEITPSLPVHILFCPNNSFAIIDEANYLRVLDMQGQEIWSWQADGSIDSVWLYQKESGPLTFFLLIDSCYLVRIDSDTKDPRTIQLNQKVTCLSHVRDASDQHWTVFALEGRSVEWLSWSEFRLVKGFSVNLNFEVQQILAVNNPQQSGARIAIGLSKEGQFFKLNGSDFQLLSTPPIRHLFLDGTGRFMFWVLENRIEIYRNPMLKKAQCLVKVILIKADLVVGEFDEIEVVLENSGHIPISKVDARLEGKNRINPAAVLGKVSHANGLILPGETIILFFSVKALAAGENVPLKLDINLEDEIGPSISLSQNINVRSKEKRE